LSLKYDMMQHMSSYAPRGTETEPQVSRQLGCPVRFVWVNERGDTARDIILPLPREFAGHYCPERQIMERLGWPQRKHIERLHRWGTDMGPPVRLPHIIIVCELVRRPSAWPNLTLSVWIGWPPPSRWTLSQLATKPRRAAACIAEALTLDRTSLTW